jgi:cysteine desulfurase
VEERQKIVHNADMLDFFIRRIYLDYAAATPVSRATCDAMRAAEHLVGNPGAIHREGVEAQRAFEHAREDMAAVFQCKPREVIFTSGLTESNSLAIVGAARRIEQTRRTLAGTHWLVSAIEHSSVLAAFAEVERMGGTVTHVQPDTRGIITPDAVTRAIRPETVMVSIGWANNELGVVQSIRDIARAVHACDQRILVHTDAGQAPLYLSSTFHSLDVDMMSLGSNKLYGPHGIGALLVRERMTLASILWGGSQEGGLRPGTEHVALAVGFAAAVTEVKALRESEARRVGALRDALWRGVSSVAPQVICNGSLKHTLPHMLNVSFSPGESGGSGEYLALALDARGVAVSTKSACNEGEMSRSHVIAALGEPVWRATNSIRFSLGRGTRQADIPRTVSAIQDVLRAVKM